LKVTLDLVNSWLHFAHFGGGKVRLARESGNHTYQFFIINHADSHVSRDVVQEPFREKELKAVDALVREFDDIFQGFSLSEPASAVPFRIELKDDARPVARAPYRVAQREADAIDQYFEKLVTEGKVRPSFSPFAAGVVVVEKKSGELRPCVDYRALNSMTVPSMYPLPTVHELIEKGDGAAYQGIFDLKSAFHQVPMHSDSIELTATVIKNRHVEWLVMPFGLMNAPRHFQRVMDDVIRGLEGTFAYMDDLRVFAKTFPRYLECLRKLFERLRERGLKLNRSKCSFLVRSSLFLGFLLDKHGISPDPGKVEAIKNMTVNTVDEIQSFLGVVGFFSRCIPGYAELAAPLFAVKGKGKGFLMTDKMTAAVLKLKHAVSVTPVLAYPDMKKRFSLRVDASNLAIGGVLTQVGEDGLDHPVVFLSRVLRDEEKRYAATEKECLAVV